MNRRIVMSRKIMNKLPVDSTNRASRPDAAVAPGLQKRMLVVLMTCLVMGLGTETLVGAQDSSRRAPAGRKAAEETTATAPQVASPNAEYALSSVRSRPVDANGTADSGLEVNEALSRRLWQSRIAAPDPKEDFEIRQDLQHLIRQVHSMTFDDPIAEPTFSAPAPASAKSNTPVASETNSLIQAEPAQPMTMARPTPAEPLTLLPTDTLKRLEDMVEDPNQIDAPLEMAELLFLSGRAAEAAVFYEKALAQIPANDPTTSEDRAWILFQLGNCLRETDMTKARDMYMKLISQYPSSPWTELAKAHGRLINWYQSAKPEQLMPQNQ